MNNKIVALSVVIVVVCVLVGTAAYGYLVNPSSSLSPTETLDLTVTGSSSCLRFLNDSVPTVYVPFTVAANQQMQLTVNATTMPGTGAYTEVYIYDDYWNNGDNNICKSADVYSIISDIKSADFTLTTNTPYIETFGDTTQKSYTVFFVIPPGGPTTFDISLKPT
ncbi:MAG: hypothetical protein ACQCN3_03615 [Candidatus Bathyarchaeia archaeon]|jgi:hypothetical protein